jgi:hypothetical protein
MKPINFYLFVFVNYNIFIESKKYEKKNNIATKVLKNDTLD